MTASVAPIEVFDKEKGQHFALGEFARADLSTFDVVLMRQDPPFDMNYTTITHMLERIHPKTFVVNPPAAVRNAPEKILVTEFPELMPPTLITRDRAMIHAFRKEHGNIIVKPLYGNGGAGVFHIGDGDMNLSSLIELFEQSFREPFMVQRYLPEVRKGDKRIILVDGEPVAGLNRVPAEGEARSNMHAGGRPELSRAHRARARDLRDDRPEAQGARHDLCRHRRDRRLSHRDQRDLADRHPRGEAVRRPGHRADDLGRDREAESGMRSRAALLHGAALPEGVPVAATHRRDS